MLNILAQEEKKKIILEYRLRLGVVVVFALGALVVSSLVLLVPSYILSVTKLAAAENQLALLESKQDRGEQEKEITAQIRDINTKITLLSNGEKVKKIPPTEMILDVLREKSPEIKLHMLVYDGVSGQERLVLTGVASDRDSLAEFFEVMKKNPTYTNVTLPISSYVKSNNIDFSIVLERKSQVPLKK